MRKKANKLLALLTAVAITVTGVNVPANNASAASAKLSKKKITLTAGKKKTIYLKKGKKKLAIKSVKSSKKKVATVKKSGKKIVITAKKKGTATITVKAKVNKKVKSFKCKVTVKSKATPTAAPTAAPSAAASSAPASQAPASAAPASAAPSDAASAAPSADVSAQPSDDASAAPSAEPTAKPVATEIVIKDTEALTSKDKKTAYVFYDVLDQDGKSMRSSMSIKWSTSAATIKANKSTGELKITKGNGEVFNYNDPLVVSGIDLKGNAAPCVKTLTIGMERGIDSVEFKGFVSKSAKTTWVKDLPADFAKDEWVMLYEAYDQNGNPMEAATDNIKEGRVVFIVTSQLVMDFELKDAGEIFTVKAEGDEEVKEYSAVTVQPGMWVDKGGEFVITAISARTGNKKEKIFNLTPGAVLQSITLSQPTDTVAEHDAGVKIPYEAVDTQGNKVTKYETIVRSSNELKLSCTRGTFTVKEENDGTAGFYWTDKDVFADDDYNASSTNGLKNQSFYQESGAWDEQPQFTNLMAMAIGGENSNGTLMIDLNDVRRPAKIKAVKANNDKSDAFAVGGAGSFAINDMTYVDQYGVELSTYIARDFFEAMKTSVSASNIYGGRYWGVKVDVNAGNTFVNPSNSNAELGDVILEGEWGSQNITATGDAVTPAKKKDNSVNFTIVSIETSDYHAAASGTTPATTVNDWDEEAGSKLNKTYTTAPVNATEIKNYELKAMGKVGVNTYYTNYDNGEGITAANMTNYADSSAAGATASGTSLTVRNGSDNAKIVVIGTVNGNTVTIPTGYYVVDTSNVAVTAGKVSAVKDLKWNQLYDANVAKTLRKDATVNVKVTLYNTTVAGNQTETNKLGDPRTALTVSDAKPTVSSVVFSANNSPITEYTWSPTNMAMAPNSTLGGNAYWGTGSNPTLVVTNQYGEAMTTGLNPVFKISDPDEKSGENTHVADSFAVERNTSANASIKGAEITDTFTLTGWVEEAPSITASVKITVGADTKAFISEGVVSSDSDKTFRKDVLLAYRR